MAISVCVQSERGEIIDCAPDPENLLPALLPSEDDASFSYLRYINPYGNTIFNTLQMKPLLDELRKLHAQAQTDSERTLLELIDGLARRVQNEWHLYLWFIGD